MQKGPYGSARVSLRRLFRTGTISGVPEDELLERFLVERDEAAFEAIVSQHGPMVAGVCQRLLGDSDDVEDAFQATFLVLVRRARDIRDSRLLGPWLYGVARRVAIRARANEARRARFHHLSVASEPAVDSDDVLQWRDLAPVLDEEVSRLPERYRRTVVLCDVQGLTHEEAARRLGCPIGTVKSRLTRAHDRLRSRLTRRGLAPTAGLLAGVLSSRTALASVPPALIQTTLRLSQSLLGGARWPQVAASSSAVLLTKGTLATMFLTKLLKVTVAGLLAVGLVAIGTELFSQSVPAGQRDPAPLESRAQTESSNPRAPATGVQGTPDERPASRQSLDISGPAHGPLREIAVRLRRALRTLASTEKLANTKVISRGEVENARTEVDILKAQLDAQRDQLTDALERLKAQLDVLRAEELVALAHKGRAMNELQFREKLAKRDARNSAEVVSAQDEVKVRDGMLQVKHAELKAMQVQVDQVQRQLDQADTLIKEFRDPQP